MTGRISEKDKTGRTAILTGVRLSFADSLKEAKLPPKSKDPTSKPVHSANVILIRGSKDFESNKLAMISALKAGAREFKRPENWFESLMEDSPKECCFRKGNRFKTDAGEVYNGYADNLIVCGKGPRGGQNRPKIKDRHKRDVEIKDINDVAYNGTLCDVVVSVYGTDNGGTARLTCSFEAVRSYQEGDRLGGGGINVDESDFDDLEGADGFEAVETVSKSSAELDL